MDFALNLPVNSTSFGQIGTALLKECKKQGLNPNYFPIGGIDLSSQSPDRDFEVWLQNLINKSPKSHNRKTPIIRLWHCSPDSLSSFSNEEAFITFIETDSITELEKNILSNKKTVFVTSNYLKRVMEDYGLSNVKYLEIGFDKDNFHRKDKKYFDDDRITFLLGGKTEHRKHTKKTIQAWLKRFGCPKYGQTTKYHLSCAIYNPFLRRNVNGQMVDDNQAVVHDILEGKEYFNISFMGWMQQNSLFCDWLNHGQIVLGMSGGENLGLVEFQAVAIGKHAVILNCNGYSDWANEKNSVLLKPDSKVKAVDNIFFREGAETQQGNFFSYNSDQFIAGCEEAIKRVETNRLNSEGLKLQERTYTNTLETLIKSL